MNGDQRHWDSAYERSETAVSWHQDQASKSLELISSLDLEPDAALVDVGGGASTLVDGLLAAGYSRLAVLDLSETAMAAAQSRLGERAGSVEWVATNLLGWVPERRFSLWHDRAVLHFLTEPSQQQAYLKALRAALDIGGFAVIGVFAEDGPEKCSGLTVRRYSQADVQEFLGEEFTTVVTSDEMHTTPSGNSQHFNWIVARRDR